MTRPPHDRGTSRTRSRWSSSRADIDGEPISRRSVLQRFAAAGLSSAPRLVPRRLRRRGGHEERGHDRDVATVNHPKGAIGKDVLQLAALHRQEGRSRPSRRSTAARSSTSRTSTTTTSSSARSASSSRPGAAIGRDIVALTDWMAARWVELGYVQPIDKKNIPNASRTWSTASRARRTTRTASTRCRGSRASTGIGYNPKKTGRELTINDLFDPTFKGRVTMLSEPRDSAGLVLLGDGHGPDDGDQGRLTRRRSRRSTRRTTKGQIRRFTGNDYTTDLADGNIWVALAWSGDIVQLRPTTRTSSSSYPEEGAMIWSDNMMIPEKAEHGLAAETIMNYVYDPEVAAQDRGLRQLLLAGQGRARRSSRRPIPRLANNPLIFPTDETLAQLHPYPSLGAAPERS